jgi:PEGA domain
MKKVTFFVLAFFVGQSMLPINLICAQTSETVIQKTGTTSGFALLDGTPVRLRLTRTISSKDSKTGENIDFEVIEDVRLGDVVVIPKESVAIATVTRAKPSGRLGKGGKLDIKIDYVRLKTGEKAALRAIKESKGDNRTGTMTGALIATGILFFPAAPIFLFIKGKNITITKGTEVTAYIDGDTQLDPMQFGGLVSPPVSADLASVTVKALLDGCEIEIDGKFVGSTPSTLSLKPGEYKIVVRKPGYAPWERTVSVGGGSNVTLDAVMERLPQ